jgi:hypothetical protein
MLRSLYTQNHCKKQDPRYIYPVFPMVPSYKTVVQYHKKGIGINMAKTQDISITMRALMSLSSYFCALLRSPNNY